MKFPPELIASICRKYAPLLHVPPGIDGAQLLWALSGNESSFGAHCPPKHEDGYCYGHKYFDASYTHEWGCLAHCSFSPWQIMATNAKTLTPLELMEDPDKACRVVALYLDARILDKGANTLSDIADAYNSGTWKDANVPVQYIADLIKNYGVAMPAELRGVANA